MKGWVLFFVRIGILPLFVLIHQAEFAGFDVDRVTLV